MRLLVSTFALLIASPALAQSPIARDARREMVRPASADAGRGDVLRTEVLEGESVGEPWDPSDFGTHDFAVEWSGEPIEGVTAEIEEGSLEWVRVEDVLRLPRGRIIVRAPGAEAGRISVAGMSEPFEHLMAARSQTSAPPPPPAARLLVPFLSGAVNPIDVEVTLGGEKKSGALAVVFRPREDRKIRRVIVDVTCSSNGVKVDTEEMRADSWMYVGCRQITTRGAAHETTVLEMLVFWDGAGDTIKVGGVETPASAESLWSIQAAPRPGAILLEAGSSVARIRYFTPEHPHTAFVGAGIGVYADTFEVPAPYRSFQTVEPLLTIYAAKSLGANSRIALFDATPVRRDGYTDLGAYFQRKSSEFFDRRAVFTVFLGGHLLAFKLDNTIYLRPSAPQGGELLLRDVFGQGSNLVAGGLLNPGVGGKSYYNGYLRWGTPRIFVEVNYIGWHERATDGSLPVDLRSIGLTIGGPLIRFL